MYVKSSSKAFWIPEMNGPLEVHVVEPGVALLPERNVRFWATFTWKPSLISKYANGVLWEDSDIPFVFAQHLKKKDILFIVLETQTHCLKCGFWFRNRKAAVPGVSA